MEKVLVGDMVEVINVPGVPGTDNVGVVGTVTRITGDLVRIACGGTKEIVVVERRVRKNKG